MKFTTDKTGEEAEDGITLITIISGREDRKGQIPYTYECEQTRKESAVDIRYHEVYLAEKDPAWLRERIVQYARKQGIKPAARHFQCSRNTVRRWVRESSGTYYNKSRRNSSYKKIAVEIEHQILECRDQEQMGPANLREQYSIPVSPSTVYRVLKRNDRIKKRKKKWRRSRDLRAIKARQKCFEVVQVDGKVLNDIPEFYPYYQQHKLPLWQFTFTCEKSGATFYSYCQSENSIAACTFLVYVLEHLKRHGITVKKVRTDKGSFAVGQRSVNYTAFQKLLKLRYQIKHRPIKHKNQNSDVERFHGLIEQYFYQLCTVSSKEDFFRQARDKQIWFNYIRKNSGKKWNTPLQILKEDYPNVDPGVLALAPIDLDKHYALYRYKLDPDYEPLTFESFFQDVPEHLLDLIKTPSRGQYEVNLDDYFDNYLYIFFVIFAD